MLLQMARFPSFSWLNNITVYIFTTSSLMVYPLMDTKVVFILSTVNNSVINMGVWILSHILLSFPLGICPEVVLLDHIVVLFSIF